MNSIGKRIKQRREELGLTQEDLAKVIGRNQNTIAYYESSRAKTFKKGVIDGLARVLKCDPEWLTGKRKEISLDDYPDEILQWIAKPEAKEYLLEAYTKYLKDQFK